MLLVLIPSYTQNGTVTLNDDGGLTVGGNSTPRIRMHVSGGNTVIENLVPRTRYGHLR